MTAAENTRARSTLHPGRLPWSVSVVIPARNAALSLPQQLDALASQTYAGEWECIVADNGSRDGTVATATGWLNKVPSLQVIDASARRGANFARNHGASRARGEFIAYTDADDVVTPGWLDGLVQEAIDFDMVGGALSVSALNDPTIQQWRPRPPNELHRPFGWLPVAPGASCAMWRYVVEQVPWNEEFPHGIQDIDFFWRAQLAGYALGFAPSAVVETRYRTSMRSTARQFFRYGKEQPRLYRRFKDEGLPRTSSKVAVLRWIWLVRRTPDLLRGSIRRGTWFRIAAYRAGRVWGSIRHRTVFL